VALHAEVFDTLTCLQVEPSRLSGDWRLAVLGEHRVDAGGPSGWLIVDSRWKAPQRPYDAR
jgi:hypothetical protein